MTFLIDAHVHVWRREMRTDPCLLALATRKSRESYPFQDPRQLIADGKVGTFDPGAERWARDMAEAGVGATVNLATDFEGGEGWVGESPRMSIEEILQEYGELTRKYPGKFFTFAGVNPHRRNAVQILERAVGEWGARGLKLLPYTGFYPDDRTCYRLYDKCAELGIPVCIHTGSAFMGYMKYAQPVYVEQPAKDFPELDFIMAHAGGGLGHQWEEACMVGRSAPNVLLELGQYAPTVIKGGFKGRQGRYADHTAAFLDVLDIMRNMLPGGCHSILFGSDYPTYPMEVYRAWCDLFRNLPSIAERHGYEFTQDEVDLMCHENAIRVMKLDVATAAEDEPSAGGERNHSGSNGSVSDE
jgi:predicted TIM-barrel fold metal-dependent hydrolase